MLARPRAALGPALCVLSLLAFPGPVRAAASSDAPRDTLVVQLPLETIVTATRQGVPLRENPAATTVIGRATLAAAVRGLSVADALASVPGIRIDANAGAERVHVSIRGQGILAESGIRGVKVLLDGLPLNDPTGVAPDLYDVDWATVERVEVMRGPSGALHGGGGSGGVLDIVTADGSDAPLGGRLTVSGGSYGFHKVLAEGGGSNGNARVRLSLSQAAGDGYRVHNAFEAENGYLKLGWTPASRLELQHVVAWTRYDEENAEGLNAEQVQQDRTQANPDAVPRDERFQTDRVTTGVTGRFAIADGHALRGAAWVRSTTYREPRSRELLRNHGVAPGVSLQYDADAGRNHFSAGVEASSQGLDRLRFRNRGHATQDSLLSNDHVRQGGTGVFAIDRVELTHDVALMAALRFDDVANRLVDYPIADSASLSGERTFQQVTGRVGIAWSARPALNLWANWGQGFLPPSTEELTNNPLAPGGFNQALDAATSNGEEVGARGVLGRAFSYEVCGFHLDTRNDFDRYRISERADLTFYRNAGESSRWGAESRATWAPMRPLALDAAYTWSRFRYTSPAAIDGNSLPNVPEHQFALDANVSLPRGFALSLGTRMQSDWPLDTANSTDVPGYSLWDAGVSWRGVAGGAHVAAAIGGHNLFGASYMAYTEPDPDGNSYQPAPKQEVYARVSVSH